MLNVNIQVADPYPLGDDEVRGLMSGTTLALTDIFATDPETAVVRVAQADPGFWSVGGQPIGRTSKRAAQIDIYLTKGTASAKQLKAAMGAIGKVVATVFGGWVHEASTITFHEVDAKMACSFGELAARASDFKAVA